MSNRTSQCCSRLLILDVPEHLVEGGVLQGLESLGMVNVLLTPAEQLRFDGLGFRSGGVSLVQQVVPVGVPPLREFAEFTGRQRANHPFDFLRAHEAKLLFLGMIANKKIGAPAQSRGGPARKTQESILTWRAANR